MDSFDSAISLIGDEYRDEADARVLDRELRQVRCLHDGLPVTERVIDHERQQILLRCTVPGCGRAQLFAAEILERLVEPEARAIALERSRLAQDVRQQQIIAEVRSAPASTAPAEELVAQAKDALADRDPDAAMRAVTRAMDPRRP